MEKTTYRPDEIDSRVRLVLSEMSRQPLDRIIDEAILGTDLGLDSINHTDLEINCADTLGVDYIEVEWDGRTDVRTFVDLVARQVQSATPC